MRLDPEYLGATREALQELVLLHGWGSNREVWRPLLASLRPWANITLLDLPGCAPGLAGCDETELPALLDAVLAVAPARAVYLGWSLGGQLATELAARHPQRVTAVVTLCSNPRFVAGDGWPGMEAVAFSHFRSGCAADPAPALRRFDSLQVQGAARPRNLLRQLQGQRLQPAGAELMAGLAWLARLDQRQSLAGLRQPQLHLLAQHDGLVPAGLEPALSGLLHAVAGARVRVLGGASHLAPLDSATGVAAVTREFLAAAGLLQERTCQGAVPRSRDAEPDNPGREDSRPDSTGPEKKHIASSFSRAAPAYDSVAKLQRDVGGKLLHRLSGGVAAVVLDLGCGTGYFRPGLGARFPGASYIGLDLAPGMVEYARAHTGTRDDGLWLVGDAESLPLAAHSVDVVFSSLAIQWCQRPELLFAELGRVLQPGGRCVFTTLGPGTLGELRQAWAAVDHHRHVNEFLPQGELLAAAGRVPGIELRLESERHCMYYQRVAELLAELKTLGAHNMNRDRPAGLTSRKTLQGMLQAYESWRVDGMLPASYDVIFGEVIKR